MPNVFAEQYISTKAEIVRKSPSTFDQKYKVTRTGVYEHLKKKSFDLQWSWVPTPHDFRRSFATRLVCEKNLSIHLVRRLLGHSFLVTTEKYLKDDPRIIMSSLTSIIEGGKNGKL